MVPTICHSVWNECKELWSGEKWFSCFFLTSYSLNWKGVQKVPATQFATIPTTSMYVGKKAGLFDKVRWASSTHKKNTDGGTPGIQHPACIPVSCPPRIWLLECQCATISIWQWRRSWQCRMGNLHQRAPVFMSFDSVFFAFANRLRIFTNKWMMMKHQNFPGPHMTAPCMRILQINKGNALKCSWTCSSFWFCGNMLPHGSSCYLPGQFSQAAHWPPFPSTCWTRFLRISRRFRRCNRPTPNSARWRTQGQPGPTCGGAEVLCEDKLKQKRDRSLENKN